MHHVWSSRLGINNSHKVKQLLRISISLADSDDVWNICVDNGGPQSTRMQYAWLLWFTTFHSSWCWSPLWKAYVAILFCYWSVIIFYSPTNKSWWPQRALTNWIRKLIFLTHRKWLNSHVTIINILIHLCNIYQEDLHITYLTGFHTTHKCLIYTGVTKSMKPNVFLLNHKPSD